MIFPLGKLPPRLDSRTLQLADYLLLPHDASSGQGTALPAKRALAPAPRSVDWTAKVPSWPMFSNDTIGDCTAAAAAHMIQCWTANAGDAVTPTDAQVVAAYSATGHYLPGNPSTDQGAVELDVLNFWRQQGIAGHKIAAYVSFSPQNLEHTRQAMNIFGGIYVGLALPLSAQNQDVWDVPSFLSRVAAFIRTRAFYPARDAARNLSTSSSLFRERGLPATTHLHRLAHPLIWPISGPQNPAHSVRVTPAGFRTSSLQPPNSENNFIPGSWGGHAVPILAYDSRTLTCITWGAKKRMTWGFFARYCDESYAPLSLDWLNAQGKTPEGLDLDALQADLTQIADTSKSSENAPGT